MRLTSKSAPAWMTCKYDYNGKGCLKVLSINMHLLKGKGEKKEHFLHDARVVKSAETEKEICY